MVNSCVQKHCALDHLVTKQCRFYFNLTALRHAKVLSEERLIAWTHAGLEHTH